MSFDFSDGGDMGKAPAFQWFSFTWAGFSSVPSRVRGAGCYAIYIDDRLVYIGSTENLRSRLMQHGRAAHSNVFSGFIETPYGTCKRVSFKVKLSRRYGDWTMRELRLLRRLKPSGNVIGTRRVWQVAGGA